MVKKNIKIGISLDLWWICEKMMVTMGYYGNFLLWVLGFITSDQVG